MEYVFLQANDIDTALLAHFQRRQIVTKCWRKLDGKWSIRDDPFVDDWTTDDNVNLAGELRAILGRKGAVIGAFSKRKLYISAHSSVERQAFYMAMGCVEAAEYDAEHVRMEPFDCQLECNLQI